MSADEEVFENRMAALSWLKAEGYVLEKTKLYADVRKGLLKVQKDRTILKADLERYAKVLRFAGPPSERVYEDQLKKLKLERDRLTKQNALLDFELESKRKEFLRRSDAEMERASMITVMEANFRNLLFRKAPDFIELVGGKQEALPDLQNAFRDEMDDMFRAMAKTEQFTIRLR